ncbi:flagellar motor switch FliN [Salinisphaera shabanensis T35B1]|jgi:flagellar motor switch protein FliN/FliY|uniref:Flagellar motor switch protein FliN n=1 Tax=Salinisphaera shabanensis E1L3A TaxID=1033802 RepID=U2EHC8_9GAMM|nr:Flagellar motor switch protein FliN [Salinisphaera shabanensis E1L3A]
MNDQMPQSGADDDWAAALAEQASTEAESETGGDSMEDAWGEAMAEQAETEAETSPRPKATSAGDSVFKPLADEAKAGTPRELDMIMEIPVTLSVELGQTRLTIRELLDLAQGSVVELDGLAGEPMSILVNGYLIAQGEVVVVDEKYGIRITEIVTRSERIHKLNK